MAYQTNTDNRYKEGSFITAKENPGQMLVIVRYYRRIYYCRIPGDQSMKALVYFERELIAPVAA